MIRADSLYPVERCLTLPFNVDEPEQAEALHGFQAAFGKQTDIESVNETVFALHIWAGHPGCPCDGGVRGYDS